MGRVIGGRGERGEASGITRDTGGREGLASVVETTYHPPPAAIKHREGREGKERKDQEKNGIRRREGGSLQDDDDDDDDVSRGEEERERESKYTRRGRESGG